MRTFCKVCGWIFLVIFAISVVACAVVSLFLGGYFVSGHHIWGGIAMIPFIVFIICAFHGLSELWERIQVIDEDG